MSDYRGRIMNLQSGSGSYVGRENTISFKEGHRDARHAAAEIAIEAENEIDELRQKLSDSRARVASLNEVNIGLQAINKADDLRKRAEAVGGLHFPGVIRKMWSSSEINEWIQGQAKDLYQQATDADKAGGEKL